MQCGNMYEQQVSETCQNQYIKIPHPFEKAAAE